MPDAEHPEIATAITDPPQAEAMDPPSAEQAVNKTTHDVDTDDMFDPMGG